MDKLCVEEKQFPFVSKEKWPDPSVNVWEEALVIPTYRLGNSDLNPIFCNGQAYQGAQRYVYPYALQDKLTDIRENKTYKAIFLENKYVKLCVLPEIGGRILWALDKTNNYDFFYHQHVIKPALIGMLGPWISGGVEWNFPHHHRPTTFMPVDYTLKENSDGSKTIWVGEIELRHRMKWLVGLTLYPDKSYIEATIKLFNRTPLAHSFLYWANVSVHASPSYQIIFPPSTEYAVYHGKDHFSHWPISHEIFYGVDYSKGVDVSWWKNHPAPTSFFAWNYKEDFLAGYDHKKQAGTIYVANHHIAPGKKFFEWGNGSEAQVWDKILTETDGPYVELMVGGYSDNQPDYSWLQPYEVKTVKQYWYPIQKMGGVKNANLEAAVNLEVTLENMAEVAFNTTSEYKEAKVLVKAKDKVVFEQSIDISPEKPFVKEVPLPPDIKAQEVQVSLLSGASQELIAYRPIKKEGAPIPAPVEPPPPPKDVKTVEELYFIGLRLEQFHNPAIEPCLYYEEALRRDPDDYRTNTALGILYCKRGLFKKAEENLNRAIKRVTKNYTTPKDAEAYYYLGVSLKFQGKHEAAYDALFKADLCYAWHAAGYYSLAELASLKGDYLKALEFINYSLSTNTLNTKAMNLKAAILRRLGRFEEAERLALRVLASDPLDFWAANELYLIKSRIGLEKEVIKELEALKTKMRNAVHSYLELAIDYGNCGLWGEAIEVLLRIIDSREKEGSAYPLAYYYLGYFLEEKGEAGEALKYFRLGAKAPTDYCFPLRLEFIDVLQRAARNNPEDAHASYYLGNLLYFFNQPENAIKEWEKSRALDATFSIAHRNLGLAYARMENNIPKAISSLEKAITCNKEDPMLYYELDQLYERGAVAPQKRLEFLENNQETILKRDDVFLKEIILYVVVGQYDKAIDLLKGYHFHVWEGEEVRVHNVYVDAHLLRGRNNFKARRYQDALKDYKAALEYPENLGVGKPYHGGRSPQLYYFMGTAYEALGEKKKARECYEKSVAVKHDWSKIHFVIDWGEVCYFQGLAFRKLGQEDNAEQIFKGLTKFGQQRLEAGHAVDFFAKFGGQKSEFDHTVRDRYLLGLGYSGQGKQAEAKVEFEQVLKLNPAHIGAKAQLSELK